MAALPGGFTPMTSNGGGGAPGAPSPGHPGAPSYSGTVDTSFANMAQNAITGNENIAAPNPGLFSGNFSLGGLGNTLASLGLHGAIGMVPGLGLASLFSSGLGALSNLAGRYGMTGQDTSGLLSDAQLAQSGIVASSPGRAQTIAGLLGQSLPGTPAQQAEQVSAARANEAGRVSTNVEHKGLEEDDPDPDADPDGGGNGPAGPGSASGPGGSAGAPAGGGDAGNPGDFHTGGTVRRTGPARVHGGEEVIRKSEASKPGVREALQDINRPGVGRAERGLKSLFTRG